MRVSIAEAEKQLPELAKRAQRGEEVILLQDGKPALQLVPLGRSPLPPEERVKVLERIRQRAKNNPPSFETDAARSQDFLYDEHGLPK